MASLNTLRTKFGVLLSVIIAGALLAFILSLKTEMGFTGQDPKIGVIDGDKITYSEYYDEYERVKAQSGAQENDEQQSAALANAVWQSLISKHVFEPGFEKMGLTVPEAEMMSMISGAHPSQSFYSFFADPRTGRYDVAAVTDFLSQASASPQAQQMWAQVNNQARMEREYMKYAALVRGGAYVNSLEVAKGVEAANKSFTGKWIGKKYSSVADSLVSVSSGDIKKYYNSHKELYRQQPSRSLSYVVFEVSATEADQAAIKADVEKVGAEFAEADDVKAFVRANRNGHLNNNYVAAAQLGEDESEALLKDKMYGPVLKNNEWTMSRVVSTKVLPDSLGIRHIVLSYQQEELADSLLTALRGGADFAATASQYSLYDATAANGGEVGVLPYASFTNEFAEALAGAKKGDIVKVASGDAIQLMQVYKTTKPSKHLQIATITYPLRASEATVTNVHNQAGSFTVNAKGSLEAFNEAASTAALTPRTATLNRGERTIRSLEDSREVARWAYEAEVGDMSEIFTVGDDYVVAILTGIDDNEYASIESVAARIRSQVLRDKKYDYILAQVAGATLEEQAASLGSEITPFEELAASAYMIPEMGYEPRVVGAIATAEEGVVSAPVKGSTGLYIFQVDSSADGATQTAEGEKVRAQAMVENMVDQMAPMAIQQMAEIEDLRGKYF